MGQGRPPAPLPFFFFFILFFIPLFFPKKMKKRKKKKERDPPEVGIVFRHRGGDDARAMPGISSDSLVVLHVGEHEFALAVTAVERVVRAVEIDPLPEAPRGVRGIINLHGRIVPVFDLRALLGEPMRAAQAGDHLIIAHTRWRTVALLVDTVTGVVPRLAARVTPAAEILPGLGAIEGVLKLDGGLVLIHDIDRFLSLDDTAALELALPPPP